MYKKLFIGLFVAFVGCSVVCAEQNLMFKGFQNIEQKQQLDVINKIQAIADNDDAEFTKAWPSDYFYNDGGDSYVYLAKNDGNSFDIIKFYFEPQHDECLIEEENSDFCVPKMTPSITSYSYGDRLIVNNTPNFVSYPKEKEIYEVIVKDNKFIDTRIIKSNVTPKENNIKKECKLEKNGNAKVCKALDADTNELLYSEHLILKDFRAPLSYDNVLKYVKYDADTNKIEEYVYSTGKHTAYNQKGEIIELYQWNGNKFKYYNQKLPDLYIDLDIVRDANGRPVEEIYKDRNQKAIRRYTADYEYGKISKIHVYDLFNKADWEIIPISTQPISLQSFEIRH